MPVASVVGAAPLSATARSTWVRVANALDFSYFATAGLTLSIPLFQLPGGGVIEGIKIKHSQAFAGPAIVSYTISVGIAGSNAKYASAFDVFQPVSTSAYQLSSNFSGEDEITPTQITATATSSGANLSVANAGVVQIWALLSLAGFR